MRFEKAVEKRQQITIECKEKINELKASGYLLNSSTALLAEKIMSELQAIADYNEKNDVKDICIGTVSEMGKELLELKRLRIGYIRGCKTTHCLQKLEYMTRNLLNVVIYKDIFISIFKQRSTTRVQKISRRTVR